jgi:hypothetical protein
LIPFKARWPEAGSAARSGSGTMPESASAPSDAPACTSLRRFAFKGARHAPRPVFSMVVSGFVVFGVFTMIAFLPGKVQKYSHGKH